MTYAETLEYLFALRSIGSKFGLERMRALYESAGRPASAIPILHIAGTNGKGSTCAMAEAILRGNGYRTGLFTSPHLERLGERVQVNRKILTEAQIVGYVSELRPLCERIAGSDVSGHPTFFELMTVIALRHFEREGCEAIVLETGLGGRLDSTNVIEPAVTAITSIGLDHQEILGETLEQIAAEKAGIIKRGVPVVLGKLPPQAQAVIVEHAAQREAPVFDTPALFAFTAAGTAADTAGAAADTTADTAGAAVADATGAAALPADPKAAARPYPQTSLAGVFQRRNAAVALLATELLGAACPQIACEPQGSLAALRTVQWAGRWQTQMLADGCELILDCSHNEEGAQALEENLSRLVCERGVRPVVVTGALGEARARSLLKVVARYAQAVFLVEVQQPRACSLEQLRAAMPATFEGGVFAATVGALFDQQLCLGNLLHQHLKGQGGDHVALKGSERVMQKGGARIAQKEDAHLAQEEGERIAQKEGGCVAAPIVVTGSVYLIGEILTRLHGSATTETVRLQDKISG